jgi:integrase
MASVNKITLRDGSTGYQVRWKTPARQTRKKNFALKRDADRHAATVENAKATGGYVDASTGRLTLETWWNRYDAETPRRATTAARDRAVMSKWWLPALGHRRLGSITPSDVRRVVEAMSAKKPKGLAPKTIRTNVGVFSGVMNRATEAELIARTPLRGIRLPDVPRGTPRFLTAEQLAELAQAVPVEYQPMIWLAGVLGLRWNEVVGLRVGSIDFLRRTVNVIETTAEVEGVLIESAPVKSPASRRGVSAPVELIDMLAEHLRRIERTEPTDLVFEAPEGGPVRIGNFRNRVWAPAVQKVGLNGFTFHSLRHSAVGFMVATGAHPLVIQRRVGHASVSTTMDVYGQVLPEVDERVAKGLGALFRDRSEESGEIWGPGGVLSARSSDHDLQGKGP